MDGAVLYPLNKLKEMKPAQYEQQALKYKGRESLMQERLPIVDCLWNDVIHCTPIHPEKIISALCVIGLRPPNLRYFKIPVSLLEGMDVIYKQYTQEDVLDEADCERFDAGKYNELDQIPVRALQYYRESVRQRKRPLMFHFIPHVLVKGEIEISDVEIVEVEVVVSVKSRIVKPSV